MYCKIILKSFLHLFISDLKYRARKRAFVLFGEVNQRIFFPHCESINPLLEKEFSEFFPKVFLKITEMYETDEDSLTFIETVFNVNMYLNVNAKSLLKTIDNKTALFCIESIEFLVNHATFNPKKFLMVNWVRNIFFEKYFIFAA